MAFFKAAKAIRYTHYIHQARDYIFMHDSEQKLNFSGNRWIGIYISDRA